MSKGATTEMPRAFWEWFDSRRREYDLSDAGVAKKANIAQSVVSKGRSGTQAIGYEALAKIAGALETPATTVFALAGYIEPDEALSPEKAALIQMFDELSVDDREEVLAIIRVRARRGRRNVREQT